jgi:hypothetical protein
MTTTYPYVEDSLDGIRIVSALYTLAPNERQYEGKLDLELSNWKGNRCGQMLYDIVLHRNHAEIAVWWKGSILYFEEI